MEFPKNRRRRFALAAVVAGAVGSLMLALTLTGTLSAFTASITNNPDTAGVGTLVLKETNSDGSVTCLSSSVASNAATCATINKYGGAVLTPGASVTTTVKLSNTGTLPSTGFTLTGGACTQSGTGVAGVTVATDLCAKLTVAIYVGATATGTPLYTGSLAGFNTTALTLSPLAAGAEQAYTFLVTAPGTIDNTYQGLTASQPLTWALTS